MTKLREDFDRIALLTAHDAIHPALYDEFLLQQIPSSLVRVLEVGCGAGAFSRALANRSHQVTGIDLSPEMIRVAREQGVPDRHVTFVCDDFMRESFGDEVYDTSYTVLWQRAA